MATPILTNLTVVGYVDLNKNEIRNVQLQNLASDPSSPVAGQVYFNTSLNKLRIYNANALAWQDYLLSTTTLDAINPPTFDVDLNNKKITSLATPTSGTDAVNKNYVDALSTGMSWKTSVRVATTANGTLASAFANGQTVDGITLVTGNRILLKNQSAGAENGIYTVNASGAPTRATDADTGAELLAAACFVQEGTTNADTAWVQTTDGTITVGTTALVFVQFNSNSLTFSSGVQKVGNAVSANVDGTTITVTSNQLGVVAGAVSRIYSTTISGNSSSTNFPVTHNLNSKKVTVAVRGTSSPYTDQLVITEVSYTSANALSIVFGQAPATGVNFEVTIEG